MNLQKISTITSYFRINFEFFEPYSVILDGNFIKMLVDKNQPFSNKLEAILDGKIFTKVTQCILSELEVLGDQFRFVLAEARKHQLIKCRHPMGYTPCQCIQELVGRKNDKKFMVCSQDIELRRALRELPNVPVFYFGPDQRITMEDINKRNKELLEKSLKSKLLPKAHEAEPLKEFQKQLRQQEKEKERKKKIEQASLLGVKVKKAVHGPNPLSIKRSRKKAPRVQLPDKVAQTAKGPTNIQNQRQIEQKPATASEVYRPKRIRKRKNKSKTIQPTQQQS